MKCVARHGAFTLIELLVVVSIVAILVAMLLPAVSKARDTAQKMACQTRMRQFLLVAHVYQQDYRVILPAQFYTNTNALGQHIHTTGLQTAYLLYNEVNSKRLNLFIQADMESQRKTSLVTCPSGRVFYPTAASSVPERKIASDLLRADPSGAWYGFAYDVGINISSSFWEGVAAGGRYYPIKSFRRPDSEMLYTIEAKYSVINGWSDFRQQGVNMLANSWWRGRMPHQDTTNYACYDGHVGSVPLQKYYDAATAGLSEPEGFLPFKFGY